MESRTTLAPTNTTAPAIDTADIARTAAELIGPRVYELTGINKDPVRFFVIGCHGNGKDPQKETAALMDKIGKELEIAGDTTPAFILFLGDNIYDYGVGSPSDDGFNTCFHNVYTNSKLTFLNKLRSWMILGNHDVNMHAKAYFGKYGSGAATGLNQVAHTYYSNTIEGIERKATLFNQQKLPINDLPAWNMPYAFYSLIAGHTQIFCLDSNTYLKDYIDLHTPGRVIDGYTLETRVIDGKNVEFRRANQAAWFEKEYAKAKAAGKQIFLAQHHPLVVCGKRSFPNKFDTGHYLTAAQQEELKAILKRQNPQCEPSDSYNELLAQTYAQQGIDADMVFAAHEHFVSYYNDTELNADKPVLRQFTSGGGGGELHDRESFRDHPVISLHQQHNGFGMVTSDPAYPHEFSLSVFTKEGLRLEYNEASHRPITEIDEDHRDVQAERLRDCVLRACDIYFNMLKNEELAKQHIEAVPVAAPIEDPNPGLFSYAYKRVADAATAVATAATHAYHNTVEHLFPDKNIKKERRIAQDLQAYFSQYKLADFHSASEHTRKLFQQLPEIRREEENSFERVLIATINKHLVVQDRPRLQHDELVPVAVVYK